MVAWMGHAKVVELLLNNGADVDLSTNSGSTSLHSAAEGGHERIVNLLIKNHANLSSLNMMFETALHLAFRLNSPAIAFLLIAHGPDPFLIDGYGRSSLGWAF